MCFIWYLASGISTVTAARKAEDEANATVTNLIAARKQMNDALTKLMDQQYAATKVRQPACFCVSRVSESGDASSRYGAANH